MGILLKKSDLQPIVTKKLGRVLFEDLLRSEITKSVTFSAWK